ncbi:hypothetical protein DAERI_090147 [Deinococcus aerius]|uniref:Chloramphenicol 3-O phosphotransferase n=1 Tax=Deinococcus aerius TaxID=200253 RepID=A0A2I9DNC0_9DEIO|nr:AAA family ATPase [Deinococcus aerius]GBF06561.1 hypothetical protein DAERI_090147 [Deinococcus aerius]
MTQSSGESVAVPPPLSPGRLIVVNGTSSAGKSTFCRALQTRLEEPYLLLGYDLLWMTMPPRYFPFQPQEKEGAWYETADGAAPPVTGLGLGPVGRQVVSGLHHAVAGLLTSGNHVLVDVLFLERSWVEEAARLWQPFQPLLITLKPPLEVCEAWEAEREATRAGRPQGLARWAYDRVYAHGEGDLMIDPSRGSPEEGAGDVLEWLRQDRPRQGLQVKPLPV